MREVVLCGLQNVSQRGPVSVAAEDRHVLLPKQTLFKIGRVLLYTVERPLEKEVEVSHQPHQQFVSQRAVLLLQANAK